MESVRGVTATAGSNPALSATQSANFFSRASAPEKAPELRRICARNRPEAAPFRSRISAPKAFLARISPGHDRRVVVSDAHRQNAGRLERNTRLAERPVRPRCLTRETLNQDPGLRDRPLLAGRTPEHRPKDHRVIHGRIVCGIKQSHELSPT